MTRQRPHKHEVLTEAFTAAKTRTKSGSFVYLVRLAYSLAFNDFNPPVVLVVPYASPNGSENADSLAAALVEPVGTWWWEDLVPVNYEYDHDKAQEWSRDVSEAARNDKVAFCGFKAVK